MATTKAWAYVHGELGDEERAAFERALDNDPAARETVERMRAFDCRLRRLGPAMTDNDESLAARCVEEWEKETRASKTSPRRRRPVWRVVYAGAALAAAALVMLAVLPAGMMGPIGWDRPEFARFQYRGEGPATPPSAYSADDVRSCFLRLKNEVNRSYVPEKSGLAKFLHLPCKRRWRLAFQFQELADTAFSVTLEAYTPAGDRVRDWSRTFSSLNEFETTAPAFGVEIAAGLKTLNSATKQVRR